MWKPSLGAWREGDFTYVRVWAPDAKEAEVILQTFPGNASAFPLQKSVNGFFQGSFAKIATGALYWYRIEGRGPYPDPASRYQPQGVHGPSQVVDAAEFAWTDKEWKGVGLDKVILYEIHVGAFTPAGTFASAAERLAEVRDLGVTAVELMPVADFPGNRNWGYDGVALFAPARCYGTPDDLRRFVDTAHRYGLAVHLDVVYNHVGPDGAYLGVFSPYYFSQQHQSPWGAALNFDGLHSRHVRHLFIENALHWIHEYHIDGLRLDATHAIVDDSPRHFLAELSSAVRDSLRDSPRAVLLIAEDVRNLACMVRPEAEGGWGLDAVWSDDFHHQMRRCFAGDRDGYFQDFEGTTQDISVTAEHGWFYSGQLARYFGKHRGTNPRGLSPRRFVFFIQNHDQVGNRAFGDRLHHQIDLAAYRTATALLLLLPQTPLLFMGQEWAASTPFQYFTDHYPDLGKQVTEGRRSEFRRFASFSDPQTRERIPDPQDLKTFGASQLIWEERESKPCASTLRFYRKLLALRRSEPALQAGQAERFAIAALNRDVLLLRSDADDAPLLAVFRTRGAGVEDLRENSLADARPGRRWDVCLTSEESEFASDPIPPKVDASAPLVEFARPGVVVLKSVQSEGD